MRARISTFGSRRAKEAVLGIPFNGHHLYIGESATMEIKIASLVPGFDARGELMTRGETVTLFNNMCLPAPARLIDSTIQ